MNFGIQFSFTADISRYLWGREAQPHPKKDPRDRKEGRILQLAHSIILM